MLADMRSLKEGLRLCPDQTRRQYGPVEGQLYSATIPSARFGHAIALIGNRANRFFVQRMF